MHAATELCSYWAMQLRSYWAMQLLNHAATEQCSYWAIQLLRNAANEPCSYWTMHLLSNAATELCSHWKMPLLSYEPTGLYSYSPAIRLLILSYATVPLPHRFTLPPSCPPPALSPSRILAVKPSRYLAFPLSCYSVSLALPLSRRPHLPIIIWSCLTWDIQTFLHL